MAALVTGKYIDSDQLRDALTRETYMAIFDDDNTGDERLVNDVRLNMVIDGAEGEVDSYLITNRALPLPPVVNPAVDRMVRRSCLEFAMSLSWEAHPEYIRQYGENSRVKILWERATLRMQRVKEGRQELPDQDQQNAKPTTQGGLVLDEGPRTIVTSSDGTSNGDGF